MRSELVETFSKDRTILPRLRRYADFLPPPSTLYSHKYQQLPLISVEEFLQLHAEHAADDEKALMFARINHELSEREALEQARQGLLKKKQSLIADNKKRKDDLASLDKDLETFIDVIIALHVMYDLRENRLTRL